MCWKVLQNKKSDDFIIATEKQYSVKFFVEKCFQYLGIKISWTGKGLKEKAIIKNFDKEKYPNLKKKWLLCELIKNILDQMKLIILLEILQKQKKF